MRVEVIVEMSCSVIENVTIHLSETTATKQIKKWFKKHYPCPEASAYDGNYSLWLDGNFEFEDHEIYQFETDVLGPTGQDICKGCRERAIK